MFYIEPKNHEDIMVFKQPKLAFDMKDLSGFVSEEQMDTHYSKHHAGYFNKLNAALDGKKESEFSLKEVVKSSNGAVFNNAAQALNHSFFWKCLSPNGGGLPSKELLDLIVRDFGSFEAFKAQFSEESVKLFGSGWVWLAKDSNNNLELMPLSNADTPLRHGKEPLLTLDVWEHAYYIDYKNRRPDFIDKFWDVVNWEFSEGCISTPFEE